MKNIYLFIVSCLVGATACAQPSDFLVIKKNQRIVKSFFAGSNIIFATGTGSYSGQITAVNKDSLYINQYDILKRLTQLLRQAQKYATIGYLEVYYTLIVLYLSSFDEQGCKGCNPLTGF